MAASHLRLGAEPEQPPCKEKSAVEDLPGGIFSELEFSVKHLA